MDTWEEVDPDELSYEELLALGEVVGTESRGLSADTIASLPSVNYKAQSNQDGSAEQCVICRLEYEEEDTLTVLSCKHSYHSECINNWLQINKSSPGHVGLCLLSMQFVEIYAIKGYILRVTLPI
ncbi:E3 ubiquitin ligase big brother-related [Thalictrum thalictroides]|uniref:E3 ubiquitin ligase big brother-related n=1 Tax=Thalictrum thalictroides TaxID=46969 RepID=A0A7J6V130_THATH|nr:E3 ubiquitin ligase big brother-related [Thalictrum thalictroides]